MANILQGGFFAGKKTYIVSITAAISAIGLYLTGDATLVEAIQLFVTGTLGATLRAGTGK